MTGLSVARRARDGRDLLASHPDLVALLLIGLVAGLLRLAFHYRAPVFVGGDSESHLLPGFDLARGFDFDPDLRRPPAYHLLVAGVITLLGEHLSALAFVQHALGVVTALLTYWLGRLTFGRAAGLVGGLLMALNGVQILSEHSVLTESPFATVLLATLVALLVAARDGRWGWYLVTGLLLGVAILTRPVAQILIPLVPLGLLLCARAPAERFARVRSALRGSVLVGLGTIVLLGPWMARNLIEHGSPTAAGGLGRSLIARTAKYDRGYFDAERPPAGSEDLQGRVRQVIYRQRIAIRNGRSVGPTQDILMRELRLTEAESDRWMRRVAIEAIAERPIYYALGSLRMAGQIAAGEEREDGLRSRWNDRASKKWAEQWEKRVGHLLTPVGEAEWQAYGWAEALVSLYRPAALGPIMPALALLGLGVAAAFAPYRAAVVPGLAALLILLASAALDGPVARYRYPIDPLIGLFAAGGVIGLARWTAASLGRQARGRRGQACEAAAIAAPPDGTRAPVK